MKKVLLSAVFTAQLFAGGNIEVPVVAVEPAIEEVHEHNEESEWYIVLAGMTLLGDDVRHGEALLDSKDDYGYGFGIDVGYRLGNGFAVEYDFTYGRNKVREITEYDEVEITSKYYTSALDLVYTYEATENLGIFLKAGYEYEWEKIPDLDIDSREHDFVFGVGIEYALDEDYKLLLEYEHSKIEGPHGDSVFAGVMFNL